MKRAAPGTYKTYKQAPKRVRRQGASVGKPYARPVVAKEGEEMKYFDCELQETAIAVVTTTWVATTLRDPTTTINLDDAAVATPACLFAPLKSAGLNGRIGRKAKVYKVKINGMIRTHNSSGAVTSLDGALIRMMLVQDMQTNIGAMTSAQLMRDAGGANTTILSFQNPNNFGRFRVLKEKRTTLQNPNISGVVGATETQGLVQHFKMTVNFKNPVLVNFNQTNGGTVADIIDNSFHFIIGCENNELTPSVSYYSRVCYKE